MMKTIFFNKKKSEYVYGAMGVLFILFVGVRCI